MKKVGIITFHFVENIGAVLQCVALSKTLDKLGYESIVINYCPSYHTKRYSIFYKPFVTITADDCATRKIRKIVKQILLNVKVPGKLRKKREFSYFLRNNVKLTSKYLTTNELRGTNNYLDAYIAGSDQIWNTLYTNGEIDSAYLLEFTEKKRCSYAASAGMRIEDSILIQNEHLFKKFDMISVREKSLKTQLNNYRIDSRLVVDPTLLLNTQDWNDLICSEYIPNYKYILVYSLEKSTTLNAILEEVARTLSMVIIDISPRNLLPDIRVKLADRNCAPKKFLSLIKNASYVVTNSFHGTVFSIIYGKEFVSIPHSKTPERVVDLLSSLELTKRLVIDGYKFNYEDKIDYEVTNVKLEKLIMDSLDFLKEI